MMRDGMGSGKVGGVRRDLEHILSGRRGRGALGYVIYTPHIDRDLPVSALGHSFVQVPFGALPCPLPCISEKQDKWLDIEQWVAYLVAYGAFTSHILSQLAHSCSPYRTHYPLSAISFPYSF